MIALLFGWMFTAKAQLNEIPLNENTLVKKEANRLANIKVKKGGGIIDTLEIPFTDDFSYAGPYPDCRLWTDKSTYINPSFAIDPPTLGVATFDGVNQFGAPYQESGQGSADTLTSQPLNLQGKNGNNVQVSFYYQPKGLGDKPGSNDTLYLEFKNTDDSWTTVWAHADTNSITVIPEFHFVNISIANGNHYYKGFQFRFRNTATLTGLRDLWHVDYVRVTEGQTPTPILNDVAFNQPPLSILDRYTAMPWHHFEGFEATELATQNQISIFNHFNTTQFVSNPAKFELIDENGSTAYTTNILDLAGNVLNGNIPVGLNVVDSVLVPLESTNLQTSFTPYYGSQTVNFTLQIMMSPNNQQGNVEAIVRNDTTRKNIVFDDYFAYDDGIAETAVAGGRIGDQFAIRYKTNVADTLKALRFNLPRLSGNITNQRINLKVWVGTLDDTPEYQRNFVKAVYVDSLDSWTTYSLDTGALYIPANTDFYVGWQQATTPVSISKSFLIGYDRNNTNGFSNLYQDIGSGWEKLDTVAIAPDAGSVMIRPVFGQGQYFSSPTKKVEDAITNIQIFPNPVRDRLNIQLENGDYYNYQYQLFNSVGMLMKSGGLQQSIDVFDLNAGWYILRVLNVETGNILTKKIIIAK
jgi:hypothetical protein